MAPSLTTNAPGVPTVDQPLRSLPLNNVTKLSCAEIDPAIYEESAKVEEWKLRAGTDIARRIALTSDMRLNIVSGADNFYYSWQLIGARFRF